MVSVRVIANDNKTPYGHHADLSHSLQYSKGDTNSQTHNYSRLVDASNIAKVAEHIGTELARAKTSTNVIHNGRRQFRIEITGSIPHYAH